MDDTTLRNLSPLDGRYHDKTKVTREIFSEHGLIQYRLKVEIVWLEYFLNHFKPELLTDDVAKKLSNLKQSIPNETVLRVKEIEKTTNHDVKAVELALSESFDGNEAIQSLIHIFLTSEDINSASYALMLKEMHSNTLDWIENLEAALGVLIDENAELPMMARTHGQPATPTTLGKELNVFKQRLNKEKKTLEEQEFFAKWGGATANYNPHLLAFPQADWLTHSEKFLDGLELKLTKVSTQIEPHDYMAKVFHNLMRANTILIDFSQDIWTYISFDYFKLKLDENEVGSSTMPHKVNPIDFENAEGNLGLANALFNHLAEKLPRSRLQRDLSDSTVLRNIGSAYGYMELSVSSLLKGISKLEANVEAITNDLNDRYELLAEPLQSFLRLEGKKDGYDQVKLLSRGQKMNKELYLEAVNSLVDNDEFKSILLNLTPATYLGLATELSKEE
ncbi:MAG: adenylosuccinate lyase [SAR86 cluster bacterium]|jgi:adenylosuccinate lyase|nr:adenylosuccinate lyase [SAR86 cluster bacterium]MBL6810755.1 adenylosuccinate lyase [SAR86 cluster bacterium]